MTFDERRIKRIECSLEGKLTAEKRRLFLSGVMLEVRTSAGVTAETISWLRDAMIDYSLVQELKDAVRAFAIIESGEDERCIGDDGMAYGLLQMHPATFKRYYGCQTRFPAGLHDTWTEAQIKSCAAFLWVHKWGSASQSQRDLVVQAWNIGEAGVFIEGKRNPEYLKRWQEAYAKVKGE